MRRSREALRTFLATEASGGIVLVVAAAVAVLLANSPLSGAHGALVHEELRLGVVELSITEDLQHWVNDALMAVFFFVVGLEIERSCGLRRSSPASGARAVVQGARAGADARRGHPARGGRGGQATIAPAE